MKKVRATRHNGRKGKEGIFKAGHNDRSFDLDNADHIDRDKCFMNVYWDCYQGFNIADENGNRPERKYNFDEIERAFYENKFLDSIDAQNKRHRKSRHTERIREVEAILNDPKTCPEETIYQLGTKDGHEDPALFTKVVAELIQEIEKLYGSNIKILDWALHMDEGTPHIHERHVFFADDNYGMSFPKQDKALEVLGFERPDPAKKQSKHNNRKMTFDAKIRSLFIGIAEKHGITIEEVPLEGKTHLEKNDFIIAKQHEEIAANAAYIENQLLKISDIDALADDVAEKAYEKACEVVTDTVKEETVKSDIEIISAYQKWFTAPERKNSQEHKTLIKKVLDVIIDKLARNKSVLLERVRSVLNSPDVKSKSKTEITKTAKESLLARLQQTKSEVNRSNSSKNIISKNKRKDMEER